MESKQFRRKADAQHYFELLDIDKNSNVSFTEFFAPLIPQLNKDQVMNLMKDSSYSINDLSLLRAIFQDMKKQSGDDIKINHLRL